MGHGCMDTKQYIILNEEKINKRFWKFEEKFRLIGVRYGSSLKIIALNDSCREDFRWLMRSMES